MSTLTRRDYRGPFGDMVEWLESPWTLLRPLAGHPIRVEDFTEDGSYVIRAEIPGIDPEKDVEVTVDKGILTIRAERHEEKTSKHHSEFHYGTFTRSVALPPSTNEEKVQATYGHGILEVRVRLEDETGQDSVRKIPVRQDQHIKPT